MAEGTVHFPRRNLDELIAAGYLLMPAAEQDGGLGLSLPGYCAVVEELASGSPATALLMTMPAAFLGYFRYPAARVPEGYRRAYEEQRAWVYAESRAGRVFAAGNSEPGVSDLKQTGTRATLVDGTWRLSGRKVFGSWGQHSHWLFSTARLPEGVLPDAAAVEFFLVPTLGTGVRWAHDWNSFGMSETESHSFVFEEAPAHALAGYPGFLATPIPMYWAALGFTAVALGCVRGLLAPLLAHVGGVGPGARAELASLTARYEAARGYLYQTAGRGTDVSNDRYVALVTRTKTHVTGEATTLASTLFSLGGGSALAANGLPGKYLRDVFAGTGLRPPYRASLDSWADGLEDWQPDEC